MNRLEFAVATQIHGQQIVDDMVAADRAEIVAFGDADEQMERTIDLSSRAFVALDGDVPVSVFGYALNFGSCTAEPWCLSSNRMLDHRREFARRSKQLFACWSSRWTMRNWVHDEHTASKRWLQWLGFELHEPRPLGERGAMFRRFTSEVRACVG